jgi:NADH-quinone oxidoreductase subunit A
MTLFYNESLKIGILLIFSIVLACFIIFLSYSFSTFNPDVEKVSAYECGFDPYDDARNVFDVRFYLVAILFIVFDLEAVYFFPWCVSLGLLNSDGL